MKHLVMLGAGHAHIHLLSTLATQPLAGVQVTLVAPFPRQLYSGMVPGFVAGHYALEDCVIDLAPLLAHTGIEWLKRSAVGLDAATRCVILDDGSSLTYDLLSVNSGPVQDRQKVEQMVPGAREHALFLRPIEAFGKLWPQVVELAASRPLRVAVMGGGAAGIELAMAIKHRLPGSSLALLTGDTPVAANYPAKMQARVLKALEERQITVIQERAIGVVACEVTLGSGTPLACDVPVVAIGAQAPTWLQDSGLDLDPEGFIAVNQFQRSTSHPQVFAAGDVSTRIDTSLARSGVYAARAGQPLANNLRAVLAGIEPSAYTPPDKTLNLLSCGDGQAIASWGDWSAQGRWVGWLKDRIDRGFVRRYSKPR